MAKKPRADGDPNIVKLWPTTILVKRFAHFQKVNPALLELFYQHRDRERRSPEQAYASKDGLQNHYPLHQELGELAEFIGKGIAEVTTEANRGLWRQALHIPVTHQAYAVSL